jgi:hypothetical protein
LVNFLGIVYAVILIAMRSPSIYHFIGLIVIIGGSFLLFWKGITILHKIRARSKEIVIE